MKKKNFNKIIISIFIILFSITTVIITYKNIDGNQNIEEDISYETKSIQQQGKRNNKVTYINQKYTDKIITDGESAIASLEDVKEVLNITDPINEFSLDNIIDFNGSTTYLLLQEYKGVPVYEKGINIGVDENGISEDITSNYAPIKDIDVNPKISENEAKDIAKKYMTSKMNCKEEDISIIKSELYIYENRDSNLVLVWIVKISGNNGNLLYYDFVVDTNTKKVIETRNNIDSISVEKEYRGQKSNQKIIVDYSEEEKLYYMSDSTRNIYGWKAKNNSKFIIQATHIGIIDWIDSVKDAENIKWSENEMPEEHTVDAMKNISLVYDYYKRLERNSFDNKGGTIVFLTDVGYLKETKQNGKIDYEKSNTYGIAKSTQISNDNNEVAAMLIFGKDSILYGGRQEGYLDVVAHEFTHRVINFREALGEAYCDIMGECIEDSLDGFSTNWIVGDNTRNIKNPKSTNNPLNMNEYDNKTTDEHKNSTIISHVAYLMWNGGEKSGMWLPIDNMEMIAKIWYGSLKKLNSQSDFYDCREAVIYSAGQLYKKGEITAEQLETVSKSFDKVGLSNNNYSYYYSSLKNQFTVNVYNLLGEIDSDYNIKIENTRQTNSSKNIIFDEDVQTVNKSFYLENGFYTLTITDLNDSKQRNVIYIFVNNDSPLAIDKVDIYTNFTPVEINTEYLEADENDIKQLEDLLDYSYGLPLHDFDFEESNAAFVLRNIITNGFDIPGYAYYYYHLRKDEVESFSFDTTADYMDYIEASGWQSVEKDPLNKFDDNFRNFLIPAENIDWIIRNIFHIEPDHTINEDRVYYYDNNYYFSHGDAGYIGHEVVITKSELLNDGKYKFDVELYHPFREEPFSITNTEIIADLRMIDNKKYWTFYNVFTGKNENYANQSDDINNLSAPDWLKAYESLLMSGELKENYVKDPVGGHESPPAICFIDLDFDEIPELLYYDGSGDAFYGNRDSQVYSVNDEGQAYLRGILNAPWYDINLYYDTISKEYFHVYESHMAQVFYLYKIFLDKELYKDDNILLYVSKAFVNDDGKYHYCNPDNGDLIFSSVESVGDYSEIFDWWEKKDFSKVKYTWFADYSISQKQSIIDEIKTLY